MLQQQNMDNIKNPDLSQLIRTLTGNSTNLFQSTEHYVSSLVCDFTHEE